MVHSTKGGTNFFDIVAGVLQSYLFIVILDYMLLIKENDFMLKRQETDDILQKLKHIQTMQII